jgi:hypothetical protein
MSYKPTYEDPTYDEDGVLMDEDSDLDILDYLNQELVEVDEMYGPFSTINS